MFRISDYGGGRIVVVGERGGVGTAKKGGREGKVKESGGIVRRNVWRGGDAKKWLYKEMREGIVKRRGGGYFNKREREG